MSLRCESGRDVENKRSGEGEGEIEVLETRMVTMKWQEEAVQITRDQIQDQLKQQLRQALAQARLQPRQLRAGECRTKVRVHLLLLVLLPMRTGTGTRTVALAGGGVVGLVLRRNGISASRAGRKGIVRMLEQGPRATRTIFTKGKDSLE